MASEDASPAEMVPFNFSRAGSVAGDQMRTLRTLDEQFARNLTHTLGAWLRTTLTVVPLSPEQRIYSEFAEVTATTGHVVPLMIEPLHVRAALSFELVLAPSIIDLLLGGSGRSSALDRELTEIEDAVLASVLDIMLREWTTAWQPFGLEFNTQPRDRRGHGQRQMPLQERTYCSRFQMTLGEMSGEVVFCMPSAAIASALRAVAQRKERQRSRTAEERMRMAQRVGAAHVHASLHFPPMQLRAADLRGMEPGTLLSLPLLQGIQAELRVGGTPVFRAQAVRSGDHRALRIIHSLQDVKEEKHSE